MEGLNYLKHVQVIHCDLKPENILYTDSSRTNIKIIDFGSSCSRSEEGFSCVQSRYYRAPEVALGLPYDHAVDMWSLGCIAAELYTGVPLFPGCDENELLEFHVLISGNPPKSMIDKAKKKEKFFNVKDGYKLERSPKSRLVHLSKNSGNLYHILFKRKGITE